MAKKHKYYVYYEGEIVYARQDNLEPVVLEKCETAQEAHDKVQAIVNPGNRRHEDFGLKGLNSDEFQSAVSLNCEAAVKSAYAQKTLKGKK
jgi:hypothetical protein